MKELNFGNSTVIIHSPLMSMTEEERKKWFDDEIKNDNPVLKKIAQTVNRIYNENGA